MSQIRGYISRLKQWLDLHHDAWYIFYSLIAVFALSFFLRLWRLPETLLFLGDQGRDALVVSRIFTEQDLVFIGPTTSVGNLYLGPLYYYFMLPFLWLSYPSPVGPAIAVALLSCATVVGVYQIGRQLVGKRAALFATAIFGFSATFVEYARFSWNPNPAPFVSLLLIWFLYKALQGKTQFWFWVIVCFAVLLQLHYLMLLLVVPIGMLWLWQAVRSWKRVGWSQELQSQLRFSVLGKLAFVATYIPLVLFDYRHNWLNARGFYEMILGGNHFNAAEVSAVSRVLQILFETHGRGMHILFEVLIGQERLLNTILLLISVLVLLYAVFLQKKRRTGLGILLLILFTSILGTAAYEHTIFDHYIAYLFPVIALSLGVVGDTLIHALKRAGWLMVVAFFAVFFVWNVPAYPLQKPLWGVSDVERTAQTILDRVQPGELYNIVLLSDTGDIDGQNYRYFLTTPDKPAWQDSATKPPVRRDKRGTVETLFIINEDRALEHVVDSPIYEIVVFPNKEPAEVYEVEGGPEITVLRK